jgi:hypothetical protein
MVDTNAVRASSWFMAMCLGGAVLAACSGDSGTPGRKGCTNCPAEAPQLDFSGDKPSYEAHVRVVDGSGRPVEKALVQIGDRTATTDAAGRASIKNLDARNPSALKVESDKGAPYYARTDAWKSGQTTHNVTLPTLGLKDKVALDAPLVIQKDFGSLRLAKDSIADATGRRVKSATLHIADLIGIDKNSQARLREFKAVDKNGMPSVLKKVDAMGHVRFTSTGGNELDLAPTKSALLELKLPDDSDGRPGDKRSLWSLDERSLTLREEGECLVEEAGAGEKRARVCRGSVSHFSVWAVGRAPDADDPLALGCLEVRAAAADDACFTVEVERVFLLACDAAGETCTETAYRDARFARGEGRGAAYCGVLEWSPSYRLAVLYDADVSRCSGGASQGGRRVKLSEPVNADSADVQLLRSFAEDASGTCANACTPVMLRIDADDLSTPLLADADNDGHYASADSRGVLFPGRRADCDDDAAEIHPAAPELLCGEVDLDCDGEAPSAERADDALWNASCALCGAATTRGEEVPGNLRDEDCDGSAEDRDGDGHPEPEDCDDFSADVQPDLPEIPGNPVDEDCDGVSLDWDGDGMPAPNHAYLAAAAGLELSSFVDCDDFDAVIYPGAVDAPDACMSQPGEAGCPVFPWSGASVQTSCEEALDNGEGTGNGVCVFSGWSDGSPLSLLPGELWGPCDGDGPLPDCSADAQCGGPLPYPSEVIAYLEETHTDGEPLYFQGMCFPRCSL